MSNKSRLRCRHTPSFAATVLLLIAPCCCSAQPQNEVPLYPDAAYNPIPSPNGSVIAFVRTGWGRPGGSGGFGRSNLVSQVMVVTNDGKPVNTTPLTDTFLAGWTPDGSQLVCYRDWTFTLTTPNGEKNLGGNIRNGENTHTERVAFLPGLGQIAWSRPDRNSGTVIETSARTVATHQRWLGEVLASSPNGRYIAVSGNFEKHLWVYDTDLRKWFDLGPLTIHPDSEGDWDWVKAAWDPWFADSARLAYFSGSNLVVSSPDGTDKQRFEVSPPAGLATPSPDGKSVAYVTFEPRPMRTRQDLKFWGGTVIWVLPLIPGAKAFPVTEKNADSTYDLRWLGNDDLVFDRFRDVFPIDSRIWKVSFHRPTK